MSHRPFTSALARVHTSAKSSSDQQAVPPVGMLINIDSDDLKLAESKSPPPIDEINEIIFNSQVTNRYNYKLSGDIEKDFKEAVSLLPQYTAGKRDSIGSELSCSGADADISWKVLIGCIVVVIVVLPLIYTLSLMFGIIKPVTYQH
ncbi:unnamed protein product [Diabrotica balteata]|uniref:Uncharacterized protein n=1 Tax=Diabrotica balteata TaxID=107213 RepID=A0A9N9SYZ1_DIABA|nr:unnamed protein product [Diabrotica balteata]